MNPKNEPVSWSGALTTLAVAGIPLLRAFNVSISEQQSNAILGFLAALIVFITLIVRSKVTTVEKAERVIDIAFRSNSGTDRKPTLSDNQGHGYGAGLQRVTGRG